MAKDKISVIVSAYNTEKYIEKCIDSILNQTFTNLELIIVDDCSMDGTLSLIEKKAKKDKRIKLIKNKENKGQSYSRNKALEIASGNLIGYIDSDDFIPENFYEALVKKMDAKTDIVVCDIMSVFENSDKSIRTICGGKERIDYINNGLAASPCNKLFRREQISKYPFMEGRMNEDVAVVLPTLVKAKKIAYAEDTVYYYLQRENSTQNAKISMRRFDIFVGVQKTLERIKGVKDYDKIKDAIVYQQLILLYLYVLPKEKNIIKRRKLFSNYHKLIKQYQMEDNLYLKEFLSLQGKKHKLYYKTLLKCNRFGFPLLESLLVSFYNTYKRYFIKPVIKQNITLDDLKKMAKHQAELKEEDFTITASIPNYNYSKFLYERVYSILSQKVKINELLILDDCSKDNSREVIDEIVDALSSYINIRKIYNQENSGSPFKQWGRGFQEATSDYVWTAEADDYCAPDFLEKIVKPIRKNKNIYISYSDTAFITGEGNVFMASIIPEIDIMKTGHWDRSYVNAGKDEFEHYEFLNCTIANVSSTLIKKDHYEDIFTLLGEYRQAGDWLFYASVMQKGDIAYCNKPLNYYRVHGNNVTSVTKKEAHMKEVKRIHKYFEDTYGLNAFQKEKIEERYAFLKKVWHLK